MQLFPFCSSFFPVFSNSTGVFPAGSFGRAPPSLYHPGEPFLSLALSCRKYFSAAPFFLTAWRFWNAPHVPAVSAQMKGVPIRNCSFLFPPRPVLFSLWLLCPFLPLLLITLSAF